MVNLTVSIINYKTKDLTAKCLDSILSKKINTKLKIILVDNASGDDSVVYFKNKYPEVELIESDKNLGFAGGHNLVLKKVSTKYTLLLNSDTKVLEGLDHFVEFMESSTYSIAGCKLLNKDGSFQPNGGDLPTPSSIFVWLSGLDDVALFFRQKLPSFHRKFKAYYTNGSQVGWVSGAAMMIKNKILGKIGFLDDNIFMYGEDVEFCLRAKRKGFKVGWSDSLSIIHSSGGSLNDPEFRQWFGEIKGLEYIYKKHYNLFTIFYFKILLYVFTLLRMAAFLILGKVQISKTYAKVLFSI